jgi:hypothetical protein
MFSFRRFKIEQFELVHQRLPAGAPALSVVQISDAHLREWGTQHDMLLETVNGLGADFVLLTGDFLTPSPQSLESAARLIRNLRCAHGVFASRGNWEVNYGPPLRRLREMLGAWGATLLVNESRNFATASGRVRVIGLDSLLRGQPDLSAALASSHSESPADFTALLCHEPLAAVMLPKGHRVDLVLSGHTHGGQIRIPWLWRRLLPACSSRFTDGLYKLDGFHLYVSRGFGAVGTGKLRFNCPAEVALFRIVSPAATGQTNSP